VPGINDDDAAGLENYRVFCRGRSLAFERRFGPGFSSMLPAASAVGGPAGSLTVVFAASRGVVRHLENPLQIPAYEYPNEYGPRAPSFARASIVTSRTGDTVFVSGTAAVRGHRTVAPNQTREQVLSTLENLAGISAACGLGPELARGGAARRHFKVYLRHEHEYAGMAELLESTLFVPTDTVSYVHADICRRDLNVEIEATIAAS
jgi:enamine deaminase RidA (YjgF/YER057c/UK114 family)